MLFRSMMKTAMMLSVAGMPIYSASAAPVRASQSLPAAEVAPVGASVDADSQMGGTGVGIFIPLMALAAIIAGILVLIDDDDEDAVSA